MDANVTSLKEDILISSREHRYVNLTFKNKQLRSSLADLTPIDYNPGELELNSYQVYEGLNQTGGTQASTYDNTKDYSAVYTINATDGYAFAADISKDDVTAIGGEVWKVERSDEKTLKVYVNFQAVIDQVSLTKSSPNLCVNCS